MDEFFKGYVKTKDKKCMEKFKNRNDFKSYEEVKDLSEFAGILADNTILVDIDDGEQAEVLMNIVEDFQLNCRVYKTTRGKHFLFRNTNIDKCYTHCNLACGITADIKVGCKNSYEILKFDNKERFIEWDIEEGMEYQSIPKWMIPVKNSTDFQNMENGDGRNQALFNYILTLQSSDFSIEEARETIKIINNYVLKEPLSDDELDVILRDDSFKKPIFYKGNSFLFDKFALFLKNNHHIKRINNQLHLFKDGIYITGQQEIESAMIEHIPQLNRAKRTEVMSYLDILIRENTPVTPAKFIAFRNGILNIDTNELLPYSPDFIITNKIEWDYNKNAYSEEVDEVLNNISCNDKEIRELLEEIVGSCFYRSQTLAGGKAIVLVGNGANGKSTYLKLLKKVLGDENTSALDLRKLDDKFSTVMMFGKLANIGDDINDKIICDMSFFKKVVTGETVPAQQKGQPQFDFAPYCKLIFSANNIPRMGNGMDSFAIRRRLVIVPFNAKFTKGNENYNLNIVSLLSTQSSMEYLIKLGVEGLKRILQNNDYTTSDKVQSEMKDYQMANDPIFAFIIEEQEKISVDGAKVFENEFQKDVKARYEVFCINNGFNNDKIPDNMFTKKLKLYIPTLETTRPRVNIETKNAEGRLQNKSIRKTQYVYMDTINKNRTS